MLAPQLHFGSKVGRHTMSGKGPSGHAGMARARARIGRRRTVRQTPRTLPMAAVVTQTPHYSLEERRGEGLFAGMGSPLSSSLSVCAETRPEGSCACSRRDIYVKYVLRSTGCCQKRRRQNEFTGNRGLPVLSTSMYVCMYVCTYIHNVLT
jgi:hypothetical protein